LDSRQKKLDTRRFWDHGPNGLPEYCRDKNGGTTSKLRNQANLRVKKGGIMQGWGKGFFGKNDTNNPNFPSNEKAHRGDEKKKAKGGERKI